MVAVIRVGSRGEATELKSAATAGVLLMSFATLGGCTGFLAELGAPGFSGAELPDPSVRTREQIQQVIDRVKVSGARSELHSQALELPRKPLVAITTYDYTFAENCGGHRFRYYDLEDAQILEYVYAGPEGTQYEIRDYVSGPEVFVEAGLWSAYDHTADSVDDMMLEFRDRGTGILAGTYSRGAMTSLPEEEKRVLARAYENALSDVERCR